MTNCLHALPAPEVKVKQSTSNKSLAEPVFQIAVQENGVNKHYEWIGTVNKIGLYAVV